MSAPVAKGPSKMVWVALALVLTCAAALAAVMLIPSKGTIVVTVAGPGQRAIDSVEIFIDGKKVCDSSPCIANDLEAGTHIVKAKAKGYLEPAPQATKTGEPVNLVLSLASEGTGIKVSAEGSGLKLFVDGKEIGPLPQDLKDLAAGDHQIRIESNGRFEVYEEKVTLAADQMKVIGPLKLKVKRGTANIEAGNNASDAKVLLVTGKEKRQIPEIPYKVEIDASKGYLLVATKKGFATTTLPVTFEPGKDQKKFVINMRREGDPAPAAASGSQESGNTEASEPVAAAEPAEEPATPSAETMPTVSTPPATGGDPRKARLAAASTPVSAPASTPATKTASASAATGQGTLNINSIPASNVLLDGKPVGKTPKVGMSVSAGSHTVVFVHAEYGRKTVVVTVVPGRAATAMTRFP